MAVSEQTGDGQKTVEELQKELAAARTSYEKLEQAHNKLKDDHRDLKATSGDAAELQKQIEKHVTDKSKLMREKDELQTAFTGYRQEVQKKELKQHLTTALEAAGAKNASTAMKLMDLDTIKYDDTGNVIQESLTQAISSIQTSDPVLFWQEGETRSDPKSSGSPPAAPMAPSVKPAVQVVTKSAFEVEMAAAVKSGKQENVDAVTEKYLKAN